MDSVDWIGICRRIVARQRDLFAATRGIADRTVYDGRGVGGDMSLELDLRCEDVVFEELERALAGGPSVIAVSEERGEVAIGAGEAELRVVIDPIDGSMNVRRNIPSHSLSIAVARGDSMADVEFGFVHDFGADEEFAATLEGGATLDGEPFEADPPDHGLEAVGIESAAPGWIGPAIAALDEDVYRLRAIGSIAITMSYVGAGRLDAMLSARPCRSVDAAASQLIVREAGGAVDFGEAPADAAGLDLDARYTVAAARRPEHLGTILAAQRTGPEVRR
ncbi:MAG TPA: inositol monophosphatase family protein [Solirubrobacterales bacterium]|nr:inositol monophosphatase family protein [Solirubrobacterales bacterium]